VLLLNSNLARPTLERLLRAAGAAVDRVVAYRTVPASGGVDLPAMLAAGEVDAITFASGSAARNFAARIGPETLEQARRAVIACIGPVTAQVARECGLPAAVVAREATEEGLVQALIDETSM
jgi:uroporphyrinogen-III synthase